MFKPETLARRRLYVAGHINAVLGTALEEYRPKMQVFEAAFRHAESNGLLKQPYFGRPATRAGRRARFITAARRWWGGAEGLRAKFLSELGCNVATSNVGIARANKGRAITTRKQRRITLRASIDTENVETEANNAMLGVELPKVQARLLLPK